MMASVSRHDQTCSTGMTDETKTSTMPTNESEHSATSTSLSDHQTQNQSPVSEETKESAKDGEHPFTSIPYVHLDPEFMEHLCWSNDPNDLYLETYLHPSKSNMINAYNVEGVILVVREKDSGTFILQDAKERFYPRDAREDEL
jgi:hypothetical protein